MHILTHWGRVTHICVGKSTTIGSDNGLSPDRRQAIIWPNAGILLIGPLGTYFSEILTGIQTFSFKKMHLKISSAKWRPFCLGINVLMRLWQTCDEEYSEKRTMSVVQSYYNFICFAHRMHAWLSHQPERLVVLFATRGSFNPSMDK